jgi:hypothetical protein
MYKDINAPMSISNPLVGSRKNVAVGYLVAPQCATRRLTIANTISSEVIIFLPNFQVNSKNIGNKT